MPFRQLHENGAFFQRGLLEPSALEKLAAQQGAYLWRHQTFRILEELDEAGAFQPIAFAQDFYGGGWHQTDGTYRSWIDPDRLTFREEVDYQPWSTYEFELHGYPATKPLYSPWQVIYLHEVLERRTAPVSLDLLLAEPDRRDAALERMRPFWQPELDHWRALDEFWRPLIKLLRGKAILSATADEHGGQHFDAAAHERRTFDGHAALADIGLSVDQLREAYFDLAEQAADFDPTPRFYALNRQAPRSEIEQMTGAGRRALELYDACEMLRRLHHDITGETLLDVDQVAARDSQSPPPPRPFGRTPALLRESIEHHDLNPHRVHVFVEGESEEIVLQQLVPFLLGFRVRKMSPDELTATLSELGIEITNLRGLGNMKERYEVLHGALGNYASRALLIADREGSMEEDARRLAEVGVLNPARDLVLWNESFEADNFSISELVRMVKGIGRRQGVELRLTARQFNAEYDKEVARALEQGREPRGKAEVLRSVANRPEHGPVSFSKSKDLAPAIALRLMLEVERNKDLDKVAKRRPILRYALTRIARPALQRV
jgi:hypothetical protein